MIWMDLFFYCLDSIDWIFVCSLHSPSSSPSTSPYYYCVIYRWMSKSTLWFYVFILNILILFHLHQRKTANKSNFRAHFNTSFPQYLTPFYLYSISAYPSSLHNHIPTRHLWNIFQRVNRFCHQKLKKINKLTNMRMGNHCAIFIIENFRANCLFLFTFFLKIKLFYFCLAMCDWINA